MKSIGTITLESERLILRRIEITDAHDMFYNWANDDNVTKYLTWDTHPNINTTIDVINSWIKMYNSPYYFQWAIQLKDTNEVIGTYSLFNINLDLKSGELGYCIGAKYWNKGYVTEVTKVVLDFAFNTIGFDLINIKHIIDNIASKRVIEKNNFNYIKTISRFEKKYNDFIELLEYEIRKEDFK